MADIRFEGDYIAPSRTRQQKSSRITQLFIDKSFGLITTPGQATVVQFVLAVVLFLCAGYFFSRSGDTVVQREPDPNLINSPQPTRPLP